MSTEQTPKRTIKRIKTVVVTQLMIRDQRVLVEKDLKNARKEHKKFLKKIEATNVNVTVEVRDTNAMYMEYCRMMEHVIGRCGRLGTTIINIDNQVIQVSGLLSMLFLQEFVVIHAQHEDMVEYISLMGRAPQPKETVEKTSMYYSNKLDLILDAIKKDLKSKTLEAVEKTLDVISTTLPVPYTGTVQGQPHHMQMYPNIMQPTNINGMVGDTPRMNMQTAPICGVDHGTLGGDTQGFFRPLPNGMSQNLDHLDTVPKMFDDWCNQVSTLDRTVESILDTIVAQMVDGGQNVTPELRLMLSCQWEKVKSTVPGLATMTTGDIHNYLKHWVKDTIRRAVPPEQPGVSVDKRAQLETILSNVLHNLVYNEQIDTVACSDITAQWHTEQPKITEDAPESDNAQYAYLEAWIKDFLNLA